MNQKLIKFCQDTNDEKFTSTNSSFTEFPNVHTIHRMSHPTIRRKTSTERSIKTEEVFVPSEFDWMGLIKQNVLKS